MAAILRLRQRQDELRSKAHVQGLNVPTLPFALPTGGAEPLCVSHVYPENVNVFGPVTVGVPLPLPENPLPDEPLSEDPLLEVPLPDDPVLEVPVSEEPLPDDPLLESVPPTNRYGEQWWADSSTAPY